MILASILAAAENPAAKILGDFGVDWWKFISQCISFSIVAFILAKYAYQPILEVLDQRRKKIAEGLANAEAIKTQLATAQEQASALLAKAGADAQKVIEEAKLAAKSLQERESARAIAEALQIVTKAREESELQHAKMLVDLKREVSRLVIETTSKVAGRILTDDDQKRLSDEAAKELAA